MGNQAQRVTASENVVKVHVRVRIQQLKVKEIFWYRHATSGLGLGQLKYDN